MISTLEATTDALSHLRQALRAIDPVDVDYAKQFVDVLLNAAIAVEASDVHVQPTVGGVWVRWRIDGVLQEVGEFPLGESSDIVARMKVLASLLTYRGDVPQEGRLLLEESDTDASTDTGIDTGAKIREMRLSTIPTLYGERAVVRLFSADQRLEQLDDLGLPEDIAAEMKHLLAETSGAILVTGPAGSGKTTTCYAALRHLMQSTGGQRSIVSIEDPVEVALSGVAQSQVQPAAGFDLAAGLKALLRQDPEVLMVSEIREPVAASLALGASLTGHLVLGSFHANSAAAAISRLRDMGVEPYVLRSGVVAILCQRLVRRLCTCAIPLTREQDKLGLPVERAKLPVGCEACLGTGFRGRTLLTELLIPRRAELDPAVLASADASRLQQLAVAGGMVTRWQRALQVVESGLTSPAEVRRVLGAQTPELEGASR